MSDVAFETPSGKGAEDENFPVGSFLLPKRLRPHVAIFYDFARAIDDVADNPAATAEEKIDRLNAFEAALTGAPGAPLVPKADLLRESLAELGVTTKHGQDLISAFRQDAVKTRYENWEELLDYCDRSAAPVGRYLLDIHGEDPAHYVYSDALCNALQVINHMQDCADDRRELDRIYLPQLWMRENGSSDADLDKAAMTPGLREVVNRCLDGTEVLLQDAVKLPPALKSKRLSAESAVIVRIAQKLTGYLRERDPIATRVELKKHEFIACGILGLMGSLLGRY